MLDKNISGRKNSQLIIGYYCRWLSMANKFSIFDDDDDEGWDILPMAIKTLLRSILKESVSDVDSELWLLSHRKIYVTYEVVMSHVLIRIVTYTRPFPDHWEKNASAAMMRILRRFPGVLNKAVQPILDATFLSKLIAALISSNSYCTRGSFLWGVKYCQH